MNIFILAQDPEESAGYHNKVHCSKMILESAQLIASVLHCIDICEEDRNEWLPLSAKGTGYGAGYKNHPCAKWAMYSAENFAYLWELTICLGWEFKERSGTTHRSFATVLDRTPRDLNPEFFEGSGLTIPPNCTMIKVDRFGNPLTKFDSWDHAVEVYRRYYKWYKSHLAEWDNVDMPQWYIDLEGQDLTWKKLAMEHTPLVAPAKPKRKTKADLINELPFEVRDNIPSLERLTITQLEGLQYLISEYFVNE